MKYPTINFALRLETVFTFVMWAARSLCLSLLKFLKFQVTCSLNLVSTKVHRSKKNFNPLLHEQPRLGGLYQPDLVPASLEMLQYFDPFTWNRRFNERQHSCAGKWWRDFEWTASIPLDRRKTLFLKIQKRWPASRDNMYCAYHEQHNLS